MTVEKYRYAVDREEWIYKWANLILNHEKTQYLVSW